MACGSTTSTSGGQTTCSEGTATCGADGLYGVCVGQYQTFLANRQPISLHGGPGVHADTVPTTITSGEAGNCDPCDPYCQAFPVNGNDGLEGGAGLFPLDGGGWTLADVSVPADAKTCNGNQCYIATCEAGTTTELVGQVLDPAGNYPVSGALVLIPNGGFISPMGTGLSYDPCNGANLPAGVGYAITDTNGNFILGNNPADAAAGGGSVPYEAIPLGTDGGSAPGIDIPLLVQVGRWRRLITVTATACEVNDAGPINLPSVQGGTYGQDNIPHIGVITGSCDPFECMLNDIGIDRTQFSAYGGGGRVELLWSYNNTGRQTSSTPAATSPPRS